MSLDKAIQHGKEHRRPYRRGPAADRSCRPGGGCPYCRDNRQHATRRREQAAHEQENVYTQEGNE